jgi:hypothetical protein
MIYDVSFWREREDVAQPVDGREREARPHAVECGRGAVVEALIVIGKATSARGVEALESNRVVALLGWLLPSESECVYDGRTAI